MGAKITVPAGVVKGCVVGAGLALFSDRCWKVYVWNQERKVRTLFDGLLEKGEIYEDLLQKGLVSVVADGVDGVCSHHDHGREK